MADAPLRLLFVVHQFLPAHVAGSEVYTWQLAKELQRRGHHVAVYTTEAYAGQSTSIVRERWFDGLCVHEAVHNNAFRDFEHFWCDPEKEAQFQLVLARERPQLVHFQHLHQHSFGYADIARAHGLPIVYTLHEFLLLCVRFGWLVRPGWVPCDGPEPQACAECAASWLPPPRTPAPAGAHPYAAAVAERATAVRALLGTVDLCISPSHFLREQFVRHGLVAAPRILQSDNGIRTAALRGRQRVPGDRLRIGYIGTIGEWKGVHLLVEAMAGLPPQVDCQVWGVLEYFPDYVARLRAAATHPGIRFLGRFANDRIADILAGIDVLVVPSLWFENAPVTIQEAFVAGVPVVTADRGGMAERVQSGRNGLHFAMGSAADLQRVLRRLCDEPQLLPSLRGFPPVKDVAEDAERMEERYRLLLRGELPRR